MYLLAEQILFASHLSLLTLPLLRFDKVSDLHPKKMDSIAYADNIENAPEDVADFRGGRDHLDHVVGKQMVL